MKLNLLNNKKLFLLALILVTLVGGVLRFWNLDWGSGNFFHPDERNVGTAVTNLNFAAGDFNPDFLDYGSLPIYFIHIFSGQDFYKAMIFGRIFAALASTLTIPLVYYLVLQIFALVDKFKNSKQKISRQVTALVAAILTAFSFGMIQGAHFTTPEIYLVFEYCLLLIMAIRIVRFGHFKYYFLFSIILAAAIATKIVSVVLLPLLVVAHFMHLLGLPDKKFRQRFITKEHWKLLASLIFTFPFVFIFSPYYFLNFTNFSNMFFYQSSLARGIFTIFYTQQFSDTFPIVYQLSRVFPYILNWPLTILWLVGVFYFSLEVLVGLIRRHKEIFALLLLLLIQGLYGGVNFLQYVKWTRYMLPLSPFIIITVCLLFFYFWQEAKYKLVKSLVVCYIGVVIVWTVIQGFDYFGIYLQPDPRVVAASWTKEQVTRNQTILTEPFDVGILAWGGYDFLYPNIYELDSDTSKKTELSLELALEKADYVIVPSNRIYAARFRLPQTFPKGYRYYRDLFSGKLGFTVIAEFRRKKLSELVFGVQGLDRWQNFQFDPFMPDETFEVFDNPTVLILKKNI